MKQFSVTGMNCVVCSGRVEKVVSELPGVDSCTVSLLTNSMTVEGTVSTKDIIKAVKGAGYGAKLIDDNNSSKDNDEGIDNRKEIVALRNRVIYSIGFVVILMYISMGHVMWEWPLPEFMNHNYIAIAIVQCILAIIVMIINGKFFINGISSLFHKSPNMDTLVALGSGASFIYSLYGLIGIIKSQMNTDMAKAHAYTHDLYFESAAMILALITVGKMLEAISKGRTTSALKSLMRLAPNTATIIRDGKEIVVDIDVVKVDDIFVVRPGESVPTDGCIIEGNTAINESSLTGESIPVDKKEGDLVAAATINQSGFIKCRATRVGKDTTLAQIIKMVSDAAATKAPISKIADKVSAVFVPTVMTIAIITLIVWIIAGKEFGFAFARAISVLVISCPCALGLATPVAIMVGNGVGAKNGILFKTAISLEQTGKVKTVVLDKTGTITKGKPEVTDIVVDMGVSKKELLESAYVLEYRSEHPLAKAVVGYCDNKDSNIEVESYTKKIDKDLNGIKLDVDRLNIQDVTDFQVLPGNGLSCKLNGEELHGGNYKSISKGVNISTDILKKAEMLAKEGKTPLYFSKNNKLLGVIAVADVIKEDSPHAIEQLKAMGIKVVMLTGDNEQTAKAIGKKVRVDEVIASVLPDGKESVVRNLQEQGSVIMVGDGINDAPALTRADIGIAIGAGTDVAIDAADVVVMKSKLSDVVKAIKLSRKTLKNIHENLFWAFFYNILGIPLAAGVFIPLFGWQLNPMFGALAMSLSSFCVVSNALRLNLWKFK